MQTHSTQVKSHSLAPASPRHKTLHSHLSLIQMVQLKDCTSGLLKQDTAMYTEHLQQVSALTPKCHPCCHTSLLRRCLHPPHGTPAPKSVTQIGASTRWGVKSFLLLEHWSVPSLLCLICRVKKIKRKAVVILSKNKNGKDPSFHRHNEKMKRETRRGVIFLK